MSTVTSENKITLTIDGASEPLQVASGTTAHQLIKDNYPVPRNTIAVKVDGIVKDMKFPIESDATLKFVTLDSAEGREIHFHSTTHLMAQAVRELFPEAKLTIGPPIENGYYYDFDVERPFTPEDLEAIEKRMKERSNDKLPVERQTMSRLEAIDFYKKEHNPYKVEILEELEDDTVTFYKQGEFIDLCRGPHIPHTGYLKHFKLLSIAGAYWRGDETRPMLQRIYGTAAATKDELKAYLEKLEEAKARDHRRIGKDLDLFSLHEEAGPGLVYWHPNGSRVRNLIETFWRNEHYKWGYELVYTPHVQRNNMFVKSGHLANFSENMYAPMQIDGIDYYAKPMNCPGHILIYKTQMHSYRDLPVRFAELGTVYRYERSGTLHGLLRVRGFTQDDAHIFCRPDQLEDEITAVIQMADFMMTAFGFDYKLSLATRPEKSLGTDEIWDHAIEKLTQSLNNTGKPYDVEEGGGAFYGPKIDVKLLDALGREWQGPTFQLDFNLPERFDVTYIDTDGERKKVVMIHRTVLGSMERFMGNLIEHYKGAFPVWLSPVQVRVLSITDDQIPAATSLVEKLRATGIRTEIDDRNEKIGYKIREAESQKIPFMFVLGKREAENGCVSVRLRGREDLGVLPVDEAIARVQTDASIPQSERSWI